MANYELFKCNTCGRKTEKAVNQTHATIVKCNITYKCTGTLYKIGSSDSKTMANSSTVKGLTNWYARTETKTLESPATVDDLMSINAGEETLAIAVQSSQANGAASLTLNFAVKQLSSSSYTEYSYTKDSGTTTITGQDDSSKKMTLRFTTSDLILVFVNGIELSSSEYDRSVPGRIVLTTAIEGDGSIVRIVVYKQAAQEVSSLVFKKVTNMTASNLKCWSNVKSIEYPKDVLMDIYVCENISTIKINSKLTLMEVVNTSTGVSIADIYGFILLGVEPYTSYDRILDHMIDLQRIISSQDLIEYKKNASGILTFYMYSSIIQSLFTEIAIIDLGVDDLDQGVKNDSNTQIINKYIL